MERGRGAGALYRLACINSMRRGALAVCMVFSCEVIGTYVGTYKWRLFYREGR